MSDSSLLNTLSSYSWITRDLPGISGKHKVHLEDFRVQEVPLYEPCGEGDHVYLWVQKQDVSAGFLKRQLRDVLGVSPQDIGMAGMKDRAGITQQWVSVPRGQLSQAVDTLEGPLTDQIEILRATAHTNKLKIGHLKGNMFELVLRDLPDLPREELAQRLEAKIERLRRVGMPNYYGSQRFGHDGATVDLGVRWLQGDANARKTLRRNKSLRRLSLNAIQSAHFNQVLAQRIREQTARTVLPGDVLGYPTSGSVFEVHTPEDVLDAQQRLEHGELVINGPMDGSKMLSASAQALEIEQQASDALGLEPLMGLLRRELSGTRRPLLIAPEGLSGHILEDTEGLSLKFFLPAGSYATILCEEIYTSP